MIILQSGQLGEWMEVFGLSFELIGAFLLAKEVWDRPMEVAEKNGINRVLHLGVKVQGARFNRDRDVEGFFACQAARKAKLGFWFVAIGIVGTLAGKVLSILSH